MALRIVRSYEEVREETSAYILSFNNDLSVQYQFCDAIEQELDYDIDFLNAPIIKEYLEGFGVRYTGDYMFECDEWEWFSDKKQFVTYLAPTIQFGCVALYYDKCTIVIDSMSMDFEYLVPVFMKRDVYLIDKYALLYRFKELVDMGAEVVFYGKSSNDIDKDKLFCYLCDLGFKDSHLTRELDAEVFEKIRSKLFLPEEMSLENYIRRFDDGSVRSLEYALEKMPEIRDITVKLNDFYEFGSGFRNYPMHMFFYIDEKWRYVYSFPVKNPNVFEILKACILQPSPLDYDVSAATKIFVLVFNRNGCYWAREYWEYVGFIAKYDKETKILEFCDKNQGLIEFHDIFQQSVDFEE